MAEKCRIDVNILRSHPKYDLAPQARHIRDAKKACYIHTTCINSIQYNRATKAPRLKAEYIHVYMYACTCMWRVEAIRSAY